MSYTYGRILPSVDGISFSSPNWSESDRETRKMIIYYDGSDNDEVRRSRVGKCMAVMRPTKSAAVGNEGVR